MKTSRIILVIGIAHFALWWTAYATLHLSGFNILSAKNPPFATFTYDLIQILSAPLVFNLFDAFTDHLPTFAIAAIDSCAWALCLGGLVYGARRIHRANAA